MPTSPTPRLPLLLAGALALGVLGLAMLRAPIAGDAAASRAASEGPTELGLRALDGQARADVHDLTAVAGERAPASDEAATRQAEPDDIDVYPGLLEVYGTNGQRLAPRSGQLILIPQGEVVEQVVLPVEQGRYALPAALWDADFLRYEEPGFVALPIDIPDARWEARNEDEDLLLVQETGPLQLHIVSAATGLELGGVEVLQAYGNRNFFGEHPRGQLTEERVREGRSPVVLEPTSLLPRPRDREELRLLIRATGHAWRRIEFWPPYPAELTVELQPAGRLELQLDGPGAGLGARLLVELLANRKQLFSQQAFAGDRLVLDSVPNGRARALAELGESHFDPLPLGLVEFEIRAGETTSATLNLTAPQEVDRVRLSGELRIPAGWPAFDSELLLQLDGTALDGGPGEARLPMRTPDASRQQVDVPFELDDLHPGSYRLEFAALGWSRALEVPEGGATGVLIDLPLPAEVRLEFVDRLTGEQASVHAVQVRSGLRPTRFLGPPRGVEATRDGAAWSALCPLGPIAVHLHAQDHRAPIVNFELTHDGQVHRIDLDRRCELHLRFAVDGETLPLLDGFELWRLEVVDASGQEVQDYWAQHSDHFIRGLRANTVNEVRFPEFNGYRRLPPIRIDTHEQLVHERTVEVVPLR